MIIRNKRGQEAVSPSGGFASILLVVAVVVLLLGFLGLAVSKGWITTESFTGGVNYGEVVKACSTHCTVVSQVGKQQAINLYCSTAKTSKIKYTDASKKKQVINEKKDMSCYDLAVWEEKNKVAIGLTLGFADLAAGACAEIYAQCPQAQGTCVAVATECTSLEVKGCKQGPEDQWVGNDVYCNALSQLQCTSVTDDACIWQPKTV